MPNWKKVVRAAVASAAKRQRSPKAEEEVRRFAGAHEKSLTSLLHAYEQGLIDDTTFANELRDEKRALAVELRASASISRSSATASANALFKALDESMRAEAE